MDFTREKTSLLRLPTPLERMNFDCGNELYVKRDDLTDFALGGNKARKMEFFLKDIVDNDCDTIVTYGSRQSNHCRIVSAAAARFGKRCVLVLEGSDCGEHPTGNALFYSLAGSEVVFTDIADVRENIERTLEKLRKEGNRPYFIPGGGHSPLGTRAYVAAYFELLEQAVERKLEFDYLFLASGTGTTQAGLVIGNVMTRGKTRIIGISVARKKERGETVFQECIEDYNKYFRRSVEIVPGIFFFRGRLYRLRLWRCLFGSPYTNCFGL